MATAVHGARKGHVVTHWWITTDFFRLGGLVVLGPLGSYDLALAVREYVEKANKPTTYAIDSSRGRCDA